ncbi:uncharacterized protein EI90DRAFT_3051341 [Cantharellus anzutake]|uniref:uncharacterized protein n=1 Tax=Cantharellus anzutake TaxID=1750568 RepID=UPI001906484E|nr:uncharacterized protein EI90DRAFT_3051341 [Cantharellus anzutake]KAF8334169.1 hypothetical protein EI90DRAFT_3051341 [Cantharellus anzutake]
MSSSATNSPTVGPASTASLSRFDPFAVHPFTCIQSDSRSSAANAQQPTSRPSTPEFVLLNKSRLNNAPNSYNVLYARAAKAAAFPEETGTERQRSHETTLDAAPVTLPLSAAALQVTQNYSVTTYPTQVASRTSNGGNNNNNHSSSRNLHLNGYNDVRAESERRRRAQELILRAGLGSPKHDDELPILKRKKEYVLDGF